MKVIGKVTGRRKLLDLAGLEAVEIVVHLIMVDMFRVAVRLISILRVRLRCLGLPDKSAVHPCRFICQRTGYSAKS